MAFKSALPSEHDDPLLCSVDNVELEHARCAARAAAPWVCARVRTPACGSWSHTETSMFGEEGEEEEEEGGAVLGGLCRCACVAEMPVYERVLLCSSSGNGRRWSIVGRASCCFLVFLVCLASC